MKLLHKGYWFGSSPLEMPEPLRYELTNYFKIIECGQDISVLSEPEIELCFFYFNDNGDISLFQSLTRLCKNLDKKMIVIYSGGINSTITSATRYIYSSFSTKSEDVDTWVTSLNLNIRLDYSSHSFSKALKVAKPSSTKPNPEISEVVKYIDSNLPSPLREEELADHCHYSVTYFSKLFRKTMGVSFRDYVMSKRISLAKQMLVEDKYSKVAVVAYQCGYKDVSYFSRIFKKKTGLTPASYRQQY
jgi:AraC-like DNA-binding protein